MKVMLHIVKNDPTNIEQIELENVASYEMTDSEFRVKFNGEPDQAFPIINDEGRTRGEWFGIQVFCTRVGLKIAL